MDIAGVATVSIDKTAVQSDTAGILSNYHHQPQEGQQHIMIDQ